MQRQGNLHLPSEVQTAESVLSSGWSNEKNAPLISLLDQCRRGTHLLRPILSNLMKGNMGNIPNITAEAANQGHGKI